MELTVPQRRQLLFKAFKLMDVVWMVVALAAAVVAVASGEGWLSLRELLAVRLKIANLLLLLGLAGLWHLIFSSLGLYRSRRLRSRGSEILDVVKATSLGSVALLNAGILFRIELFSPELLALFWAISTGLTVLGRLAVRFVLERARLRGRNLRNVLVVGTNVRAWKYAQKLTQRPELGYNLLGFVDDEWGGLVDFRRRGGRLLSGIDGLLGFLRKQVVDEVVIALPLCSSYPACARVVGWCEEQGVTVRFLSDLFNLSLARAKVELFEDEPVITLSTGAMQGWPVLAKRLLDCSVALVLLTALAPLFLLTAILIKLTSPGPVFFVQERVGLGKRKFRLYKFRTMVADAERQQAGLEHLNEVSGPVFKIANDPRVTPVGRFLRKASIDELPQLINVLKGDMSLVGPRPLPVRDYQGFDQDWHRRRFSVRPGITCLWQVNGRSSLPFEQWMKLDMEYIDRWSFWMDLKILARTVPAVLRGGGAA